MLKSQVSSNISPAFNVENHTKELSERFGRLIKQLGHVNKKGSARYAFEVDFMYALNEVKNSPIYLQGKMFDRANGVITSLINHLKTREEVQQD